MAYMHDTVVPDEVFHFMPTVECGLNIDIMVFPVVEERQSAKRIMKNAKGGRFRYGWFFCVVRGNAIHPKRQERHLEAGKNAEFGNE